MLGGNLLPLLRALEVLVKIICSCFGSWLLHGSIDIVTGGKMMENELANVEEIIWAASIEHTYLVIASNTANGGRPRAFSGAC